MKVWSCVAFLGRLKICNRIIINTVDQPVWSQAFMIVHHSVTSGYVSPKVDSVSTFSSQGCCRFRFPASPLQPKCITHMKMNRRTGIFTATPDLVWMQSEATLGKGSRSESVMLHTCMQQYQFHECGELLSLSVFLPVITVCSVEPDRLIVKSLHYYQAAQISTSYFREAVLKRRGALSQKAC